jgi:type II secretory pathway component PulJ
MTLSEILVAACLLLISSSASLQVWASGNRWSQRSEQRQHQQQVLDTELRAVEARLLQLAGTTISPSCATAAAVLAAQLPQLRLQGEGLLLRLDGPEGGERQRWYDPAAYGLCGGESGHESGHES